MRARYLLPCIPVILAGHTFADEAELLPEMVVTANRVPTPTDHVGAAIDSVTREEMEKRQTRRVEDLLRQVPGVTVRRAGSFGTASTVNIRGLGARNTLVLLDGVEIADPSRSQVQYEFGALSVGDIERIEVLRGPQSSLYGSDAAGGVINIITKRATRPFEGNVSGEIGSYATKQVQGAVRGKVGIADYGLSVSGFDTKGVSAFSEDRGGVEADGHRNASSRANLGLQPTEDWRVDMLGGYSYATQPSDPNNADVVDRYYEKRETFAAARTHLDTLDARWRHTIGYAHTRHEREFKGRNNASNGDSYDGTKDKIDYLSSFEIDGSSSLVAGLENERERLDQRAPRAAGGSAERGIIDKTNDNQGYFASYAFEPIADLHLNSSLRHDQHQKFGGATTWRQTAAYNVAETGTKLRASYATGFVAPSLYELNDPCIGRQNLQPEHSRGWDAGFDRAIAGKQGSLSATYFESRVKNQITFVTTGIACGIFTGNYANLDRTLSRGIELGGHYKLGESLTLAANYTFTNAKNAANGQELFDIPKHQAYAALDWRFVPEASAGLSLTYRDNSRNTVARINSEYYLVDLRGSYDVTDTAELYARIENLFDAHYEEIWGFGALGRTAYLGTRLKF